jgi:hypothetical protein
MFSQACPMIGKILANSWNSHQTTEVLKTSVVTPEGIATFF